MRSSFSRSTAAAVATAVTAASFSSMRVSICRQQQPASNQHLPQMPPLLLAPDIVYRYSVTCLHHARLTSSLKPCALSRNKKKCSGALNSFHFISFHFFEAHTVRL